MTKKHHFTIGGRQFDAAKPDPGLYVVATPIGNLRDVTLRALETLAGVDLVACEDSRVTRRLLERYRIETPTTPYNDHSDDAARARLIDKLKAGESVALVSDAGTPLISDPGFRLVAEARAAGCRVVPVPGASALTALVSSAGLPSDRFLFIGFLPPKTKARRDRLQALASLDAGLVLYEGPTRTAAMLKDAAAVLGGDRRAVLARELTKIHETFLEGSLDELAAKLAERAPRGEIALFISPPTDHHQADRSDIADLLDVALSRGSLRDAVSAVSEATGASRRTVYGMALARMNADDRGT